MKRTLLFVLGGIGLLATVFAFHGNPNGAEKRVEYYPNGQVQIECELQEGVRQGECRRFWPDGKPQAEGRYEDGTMNGTWTFWNADGTPDLSRTGSYVAGTLKL